MQQSIRQQEGVKRDRQQERDRRQSLGRDPVNSCSLHPADKANLERAHREAYDRLRRALDELRNHRNESIGLLAADDFSPVRLEPELYIERLENALGYYDSGTITYEIYPYVWETSLVGDNAEVPARVVFPRDGSPPTKIQLFGSFFDEDPHQFADELPERCRVLNHEFGRLVGVDSKGVAGSDPIDARNINVWDDLIRRLAQRSHARDR